MMPISMRTTPQYRLHNSLANESLGNSLVCMWPREGEWCAHAPFVAFSHSIMLFVLDTMSLLENKQQFHSKDPGVSGHLSQGVDSWLACCEILYIYKRGALFLGFVVILYWNRLYSFGDIVSTGFSYRLLFKRKLLLIRGGVIYQFLFYIHPEKIWLNQPNKRIAKPNFWLNQPKVYLVHSNFSFIWKIY